MSNLKKGLLIAGKQILSIRTRKTPAGHQRKYYSFECDCGEFFETIHQAVTQAKNGLTRLCCRECQKDAKLSSQSHKRPAQISLRRPERSLPEAMRLSEATRRMIRQTRTDVLASAKQILARHLRTCLKNQTPLESFDRLWIEAIGEAKETPLPDWTPENIHEGLSVCRFDQYTQPTADW